MEIRIVPMTLDHVDQVAELEKLIFSIPWTYNMIANELKNEHASYYVAITDESLVIGYIGLHVAYDQGYITNIAVLPDFRSLGVGASLLSRAINRCNEAEVEKLTLEVRQSNEIAISLYQKFGFHVVGKRINYYRNPTEDALIMLKSF